MKVFVILNIILSKSMNFKCVKSHVENNIIKIIQKFLRKELESG